MHRLRYTLAALPWMLAFCGDDVAPPGLQSEVVVGSRPLELDNPTDEEITQVVWGGAFELGARVDVGFGHVTNGALVFATRSSNPEQEELERTIELTYADGEFVLNGGEPIAVAGDPDEVVSLQFDENGRTIELSVGERRGSSSLADPLPSGSTLGTYVRVPTGSSFELASLSVHTPPHPTSAELEPTLRSLTDDDRLTIGTATDVWPPLHDPAFERMLGQQFDLAAPSEFYWTTTRPAPGVFAMARPDAMVNYALVHEQRLRGYHLVWDFELPDWLNELAEGDDASQAIDAELREHVGTIVGRYRGIVHEWVVVNEAIWGPEDTGEAEARLGENIWLDHLGPDYIATSFEVAHEADPDAILIYNETGAEALGAKADFMFEMLSDLVDRGVPVHGVGLQFHIDAVSPPNNNDVIANMARFGELGLGVYITELDVNMLDVDGSQAQQLALQAELYANVLEACSSVEACRSYTTWGFSDRYAWYDREGGAAAPLLFTEDYEPKPAFFAVRERLD